MFKHALCTNEITKHISVNMLFDSLTLKEFTYHTLTPCEYQYTIQWLTIDKQILTYYLHDS
jgi:hypothetical protein